MSNQDQASSSNNGDAGAPCAPAGIPEKKRRRPPLACEQCRRRKIKCDRNSPCGHCTRARIPDCTYAPIYIPESKARSKLSSKLPSTRAGGAAQRPVLRALSSDAKTRTGEGCEAVSDPLGPSKAPSSVPSSNVGSASDSSNVDWLVARVHELEDKLANAVHITEPGGNPFVSGKGDSVAPLTGIISKTRYFGNSHWINVTDLLPTEFALLGRAEADKADNPGAANMCFVMQMQLCLALGATVYDEIFSMRAMAMHWVYEAQLWLMLPPEKSKMTISGIQTLCLLVLAKSCCGVGQDLTWITMGSLVRMAMYMGLHRDPKHLGKMTVCRAEIRRRLWATVLELNLQCAFEAGGSPLLHATDYDTEPPANLNDDQLVDENDGETPLGHPSDTPTATSVQLAILKSLPLRLNLIRLVNDFRASRPYDEILRLNSELTKACRELSHKLSCLQTKDAGSRGPTINYFHVSVAELFLYRFFHALHQTAIAKSFNDHRFYFSRRMCLDSALKLLSLWGLSGRPLNTQAEGQVDFMRIVDNGTGLFRYIAVQSLFFVAVELIHQKKGHSVSLGYLPSIGDSDLRACLESAKSWSLERVRAGETNGKGHCFLAACLGHIDALTSGLSREEVDMAILRGATESANSCLVALTEVAEREGVPSEESTPEPTEMDGVTNMPLEWMGDWAWDDMSGISWEQWSQNTFGRGMEQSLPGHF
ncbi:C6 zinc finger protein [Metarhizium acridum CQMa 102]|uniref:C6 zinc finger protein n=1 Tax=Metarhizium acridum (strain CQMa 102) TaxID=655827 RepID=E9EE58_METAQ|nr:C6 zinc finger protein [Metarhizium acridum CQMa 102]EFY85771.1 C6 zinc finger protein [Metarhizium acridum CQMa 102]